VDGSKFSVCASSESQNPRIGFTSGGEKDEIHPAQRDDRGKVAFDFELDAGSQPGLGPKEQE
jgi:hypothetical protein